MPLAGQASGGSGQHEWAVMGTVPQLEEAWSALKPNLALQYPFELDVFQKEAIVHMEVGGSQREAVTRLLSDPAPLTAV